MKQPYGIFAEVSGELKLIHAGSVRFSRANRFALKQTYPGVFFAHYHTIQDPPTLNEKGDTVPQSHVEPVGERHKPKHLEVPDWSRRPERKSDILRELELAANSESELRTGTRKRKPRRHGKVLIDYDAVDPNTGETLGDVVVEIIRERAARGIR